MRHNEEGRSERRRFFSRSQDSASTTAANDGPPQQHAEGVSHWHSFRSSSRACDSEASASESSVGSYPTSGASSPITSTSHPTSSGTQATNHPSNVTSQRKRFRVTPVQLAHLERVFAEDRFPTAAKRKEIADVLGMNERQTQVWFQNRRTKAKLLEYRARTGRGPGSAPIASSDDPTKSGGESKPSYLLPFHVDPGSSGSASRVACADGGIGGDDSEILARIHEDEAVFIIPCSELCIGTFRRVSTGLSDLIGYICEPKKTLAWYVYSAGIGFKMEIPFDNISSAKMTEDVTLDHSRAIIHLSGHPVFYCELSTTGVASGAHMTPGSPRQWQRCDDWTENCQGSSVLIYQVVGRTTALKHALARFLPEELSDVDSVMNEGQQPSGTRTPPMYSRKSTSSRRSSGASDFPMATIQTSSLPSAYPSLAARPLSMGSTMECSVTNATRPPYRRHPSRSDVSLPYYRDSGNEFYQSASDRFTAQQDQLLARASYPGVDQTLLYGIGSPNTWPAYDDFLVDAPVPVAQTSFSKVSPAGRPTMYMGAGGSTPGMDTSHHLESHSLLDSRPRVSLLASSSPSLVKPLTLGTSQKTQIGEPSALALDAHGVRLALGSYVPTAIMHARSRSNSQSPRDRPLHRTEVISDNPLEADNISDSGDSQGDSANKAEGTAVEDPGGRISSPYLRQLLGLEGRSFHSIQGEEAAELGSKLHLYLRSCSANPGEYTTTLKLLQDLCSSSGELPSSYRLTNVTFDRGDVVGKGGEASVYRGDFGGRAVVVREVVMPRTSWCLPAGRKIIKLIQREVITHAQLDHPNIIRFLGVFCDNTNTDAPPMMVLPLAEKGCLADLILMEVIKGAEYAWIITGVGRALAYLHSRNPPIYHGDLHPGNVLIDWLNNALLCDFGLSRIRHEVTRTLTIMREGGRTRFLAPELLAGEEDFRTTPASDIFSLSMTFLNVWTREVPFVELTSSRKVEAAIRKGLRPQRPVVQIDLPPQMEEEFWLLLVEMWAHEPASRPLSDDVQKQLEAIFTPLLDPYGRV